MTYPDPFKPQDWVSAAQCENHYMLYPTSYYRNPHKTVAQIDRPFLKRPETGTFRLRTRIGEGGFGDVYLCDYIARSNPRGQPLRRHTVALKKHKNKAIFHAERRAHRRHAGGKHIVHTLVPDVRGEKFVDRETRDVVEERFPYGVLYHWYPLGSFDKVIRRLWMSPHLWAPTADMYWEIFRCLASGLSNMAYPDKEGDSDTPDSGGRARARDVIHFDLDPMNVLTQALEWSDHVEEFDDQRVDRREPGGHHKMFPKLLIADFGCETDIGSDGGRELDFGERYGLSKTGKYAYMPPEQDGEDFKTLYKRDKIAREKQEIPELEFFKHPKPSTRWGADAKFPRGWTDHRGRWLPEIAGNYGYKTNVYQIGWIMASLMTGFANVRFERRMWVWETAATVPRRNNDGPYLTNGSFVLPSSPVKILVRDFQTDDEKFKMHALQVLVCQCLSVAPRDRPRLQGLNAACEFFDRPVVTKETERYAHMLQKYLLGDENLKPPRPAMDWNGGGRGSCEPVHHWEKGMPFRLFKTSDDVTRVSEEEMETLRKRLKGLPFRGTNPPPSDPDITCEPPTLAVMPAMRHLVTKPLHHYGGPGSTYSRAPPEQIKALSFLDFRRTATTDTPSSSRQATRATSPSPSAAAGWTFVSSSSSTPLPASVISPYASYFLAHLRGGMGVPDFESLLSYAGEARLFFSFGVGDTVLTFLPPPPQSPRRLQAQQAGREFYHILRFKKEQSLWEQTYLLVGRGAGLESSHLVREHKRRLLCRGNADRWDRSKIFQGGWREMLHALRTVNLAPESSDADADDDNAGRGGYAGPATTPSSAGIRRLFSWNVLRTNYSNLGPRPRSPNYDYDSGPGSLPGSPSLTSPLLWRGRQSQHARFLTFYSRLKPRHQAMLWNLVMTENAQLIFCVDKNALDCIWFWSSPLHPDSGTAEAWFINSWGREEGSVVNFIIGFNMNRRLTASDAAFMLMDNDPPGNFGLETLGSLRRVMGPSQAPRA
ncbi:hypothetical protein MKZ38_002141 [Zalerion maritima]|uniref:Protein kinase domain-containing protein n=1 Tax=Zalerion maritima TaxID=339359 RepID=A0AAD5RQL7_9PEZI|nr:hypothetical protein MKZ38_002141 [Zalerion maritima]